MACNDAHAVDLLDACRRAGVDVPDTVAIIGVDNDESLCRLTKPELSSVVPDPRRVGYEAAQMLDEMMSGKRSKDNVQRILISPRHVVTRASTQGTAIADEVIARPVHRSASALARGSTPSRLLRESGLSRRAFYQRFQNLVGRTPHEEITRARLGRTKRLLQETNLSNERVAELTGYCSAAHMSVAFRRELGMPPGEYGRRTNRPN